jgi:hypothetical protein
MSAAMPLPPFRTIEAALVRTTEYLARELTRPGTQPPPWNDFEWRVAQAVAALLGISALLSESLQWRGPQHWQTFLAGQKTQTLLRQQNIAGLLSRIHSQARSAGVGIVALKGSALLGLGIYRPGMRPMGDVDLLVDPGDVDASARLLTAMGYVESFETWRHKTFVPREARGLVSFGEHVDHPVNIELHTRIVERLPLFETDITSFALTRPLRPGLNDYPSLSGLMRHLLLHAAGNMRARALRLIQLHDIALLASRMNAADWEPLIAPDDRHSWWVFPPLVLTSHYYPAAIPPAVLDAAERACRPLLRHIARRHRLCDVSWSKIRIQAFPGVEWSRSPREAALFAKSRVWPARSELADLRQVAAAVPALACTPWYGLPHGVRILRWIFTRPPRVQTIFSVRCALGHEI